MSVCEEMGVVLEDPRGVGGAREFDWAVEARSQLTGRRAKRSTNNTHNPMMPCSHSQRPETPEMPETQSPLSRTCSCGICGSSLDRHPSSCSILRPSLPARTGSPGLQGPPSRPCREAPWEGRPWHAWAKYRPRYPCCMRSCCCAGRATEGTGRAFCTSARTGFR